MRRSSLLAEELLILAGVTPQGVGSDSTVAKGLLIV